MDPTRPSSRSMLDSHYLLFRTRRGTKFISLDVHFLMPFASRSFYFDFADSEQSEALDMSLPFASRANASVLINFLSVASNLRLPFIAVYTSESRLH